MNFFKLLNKIPKLLAYGMLALLTCISISCTNPSQSTTTSNTDNIDKSSDFKVAILLPDPIEKGGWSKAGYDGLKLIEQQLNAEVAYTADINNKKPAEIEDLFRKYAQQDFNFVIGHGSQSLTVPAASTVSKEFPRTKFAVIGADNPGNNRNMGILNFRDSEIGYLTGVVAAIKSKTNKIGYIGGIDYNSLKEEAEFFAKGAKSIKPNINITTQWVGSWIDSKKAQEIAEKQIKSGIDIIAAHSGPAEKSIHEQAKQAGIKTISWTEENYKKMPQTVITNAVQKVPELLLQGATLVRKGRWEGKRYRFGLREKVMELTPFRNALTKQQESAVEKVKDDILTGKIAVTSNQ